MEQTLKQNERRDRVNDNLTLIQRVDGLTFGTDALLLAAYINRGNKARALELGAGTGIISLLLATRQKVASVECVEIQPSFAEIARKNVLENSLSHMVTVSEADIRNLSAYGQGDFDIVFANPPYMRADGPACDTEEKQIARHEVFGGIEDFVIAAAKKLKWGGRFFVVWRPDRLSELFSSLSKHGIEPKRMTFVHASTSLSPSIVLVEAKRGGKPGMKVTAPLFIGGDLEERSDSPDMCYILEKGCFPKKYE
jgi:tRNA1(Val) A37 N6-methylase TrmN6